MLRMPGFEVHLPTTAAEAVALRAELEGSEYVAGGTDLLVNLKHKLHEPKHLVSLQQVADFDHIELDDDGTLILGAGTTLHRLATSDLVRREVPGLAAAVGSIAGPQHRRMGTLGGNVMLDTRCLFYNQTKDWRRALGWCLKADGDWCHVIGSAKACVAAQSSDSVPMLMALDARIVVLEPGADAPREVPLRELFTKDGRRDRIHTVPAESLVTAIHVPPRPKGHRSVYRKVRTREAVDYPQLSIAIAGAFDGDGPDAPLTALEVVVGAMLPQPKRLRKLDEAVGKPLTDELVEHLAERGFKQVRPQPNIHGSPEWRRHMAGVELRRGLQELRTQ